MDKIKLLWIVIALILIIISFNLIMDIFTKSELKKGITDIKSAQKDINISIVNLRSATSGIDNLILKLDSSKIELNKINESFYNLNFLMQNKINTINSNIINVIDKINKEQKSVNELQNELNKLD